MGEKKVAMMVLKVNLQCSSCYLKVKKVLCKFPQIQDQVYDEKQNRVTIKVVCCSPEKIRDKICCEGGCSIKSIEILPESGKCKEVIVVDPRETGNAKQEQCEELPTAQSTVGMCCRECNEGRGGRPCHQLGCGQVRCGDGHYGPGPVPIPYNPNPVVVCCRECYEVRGGGPCHQLRYRQVRYDVGYCGRPVYDSWGSGCGCDRVYCRSQCTDYISDENPTACRIM